MNKVTDNEIIQALECCISDDDGTRQRPCNGCPLLQDDACSNSLRKLAFDLINRQKAEIERLQKENKEQKLILEAINDEINPLPFETDFDKAMKTAKSEAYREFAERLKCRSHRFKTADKIFIDCVPLDYIDNLLKELTESKNDLEGRI